jgi:hypothetical protein
MVLGKRTSNRCKHTATCPKDLVVGQQDFVDTVFLHLKDQGQLKQRKAWALNRQKFTSSLVEERNKKGETEAKSATLENFCFSLFFDLT